MKTSLMTGEPTPEEKEMKPVLKKLSQLGDQVPDEFKLQIEGKKPA